MILFIDSSALVKKYLEEVGSDETHRLLVETSAVAASLITPVEMTSFLERSKREGRIDSPTYRRLVVAIGKDLFDGAIYLVGIDRIIIKEASRLVRQRRLRVQDAIQLASAIFCNKEPRVKTEFVCADRDLLQAARLEGLTCHDVSQ